MELLISLIAGELGANGAGKMLPKFDQGTLINSIAGIVGGGLGGSIIGMLGGSGVAEAAAGGGMDIASIISQLVSGGVGGGVLMAIVGIVRSGMNK